MKKEEEMDREDQLNYNIPIAEPHYLSDQTAITFDMLACLCDFSPDALVVIDAMGVIVLVNELAEHIFGYNREELQGQLLEILLPERLRTIHVSRRLSYMQAPCTRAMGMGMNLIGRRKDGSEFPVDISLRPLAIEQTLYIIGSVRERTAQSAIEQERAQLIERLRLQNQLITFSHDAILIRDPQSYIHSWNQGAEDLYGWREADVIGQLSHQLLSTRFPQPLEAIERFLEQTGHWEGDLLHQCRDGHDVLVESRWVLVKNEDGVATAILEINRDVTERRRLEQVEQNVRREMKARLDILQLILNHLPIALFLVQGPEARLLLANRAASDLWGVEWQQDQSMKDFIEQGCIQLATANGQELLVEESATMQALQSGQPVLHKQRTLHRPDGVTLQMLVDAIPLDLFQFCHTLPAEMAQRLSSSERVALVIYQDVTTIKEAEVLKDHFISLATHELRTPITIVAGYIDMLLKRLDTPLKAEQVGEQRKKLLAVKEATHHLTRLTEDVLDATRIQSGLFQLDLRPVDLVALTRSVVEQLQTTTNRHTISLHTSLDSFILPLDRQRIEQVLTNLLSNAIKYSPQGGLITVTLEEENSAHEIYLSISDHGLGIPQEQQASIFGRFVRADNVRAAHISGTGLGLYLCRELIERHGGRIWFESKEGAGTTFFFSLPFAPPTR